MMGSNELGTRGVNLVAVSFFVDFDFFFVIFHVDCGIDKHDRV